MIGRKLSTIVKELPHFAETMGRYFLRVIPQKVTAVVQGDRDKSQVVSRLCQCHRHCPCAAGFKGKDRRLRRFVELSQGQVPSGRMGVLAKRP